MTGMGGFFSQHGCTDAENIFEKIMNASAGGVEFSQGVMRSVREPCRGGMGLVPRAWYTDCEVYAFSDVSKSTMLIHGEVYGSDAQSLLNGYALKNEIFLKDINADGAFSGAIFDGVNRKILLFTDYFGLEPLYYYFRNGQFAFSSNIKGLLTIPDVDKAVDLNTFASFWNFGYALLDHTPFKHITLVPPATVCVLDLDQWKMEHVPYGNLVDLFDVKGNHKDCTDLYTVADAFNKAVLKRSHDFSQRKLGLSLSGGLDSRAILGGLGERGKHLTTYTLGLPGCADERLAERMAKISGSRHEFIPIKETELHDFESLARMIVSLSDGLYHPHESTERVALNYLETRPFDIMLRGHGGEIAKAALAYPFQAERAMAGTPVSDTVKRLFGKASLARMDIDMASLLQGDVFNETENAAWSMFQQAAIPAVEGGVSNHDICIYLYINQLIRRQVVASLSLFRTRVGIRLPFLDRDFIDLLLRLPSEQRWAGEFHRYYIHAFAPKLESIPDSNTGAPLHAGPLRLLITDKINSVMKRIGVKGFRHYTEFQHWQRKYFSDVTRTILFSDQCLDRGYYRQDGLKDIFERHISGKKDYAHFIGTAVAIELWHRTFVD